MAVSCSQIILVITLIALAIVVYFTMNSCDTFNNIKGSVSENFSNKVEKLDNTTTTGVVTQSVSKDVAGVVTKPVSKDVAGVVTQPVSKDVAGVVTQSVSKDVSGVVTQSVSKDVSGVVTSSNSMFDSEHAKELEREANEEISEKKNKNGSLFELNKFHSPHILSSNKKDDLKKTLDNTPMFNNSVYYSEGKLADTNAPIQFNDVINRDVDEDVNDIYPELEGTDLLSAPLADRMYYTNSLAQSNKNGSYDLRGDIMTEYIPELSYWNQSAIYGAPKTTNRLGDN